ncbi:ABC transporter permease [Alteromonas sp. W364]|jgi:sodium transport system permease protein|uniref:ABC transporter permease n=1 Tax=Alteromonas sp. W364 TaxID=3075610 RepID=UPI0028866601|nr:ABC transporter permease [Alteromonas sp. W364]MDT0628396.1 ABC transporter permease [Alteromonas sp. W364]
MWLVFQKEIKELLRDRKTLFFMIALPILLFPLIIGGAIYVGSKVVEGAKTEERSFAIIGGEYSSEFTQKLNDVEQFKLVELPADIDTKEEITAYVKADNVDFVIEIPENYSRDVLTNGKIVLTLYRNQAGLAVVESVLNKIVDEFSEEYQNVAFENLTLNEEQQKSLLEPIKIEQVNVADERETQGENIGGLIPYFIFMLCLQGAMLPASDLGAGEKERGTLETLLITPIERNKIVLGKFFTIAFAGVTSALVTVLSIAIWTTVLSQGAANEVVMKFMSSIGAIDFILVFLMLVPVVAIFAAVLLTLSIYARSFKEAQGYMTPLVFVVIIPVIFAMLPGVELKGIWAWVPLTNVALAIKELIKGTMDYVQLFAIFGSTAIIAGGLLAFCIHWFKQEKVLFR